jgi:hypothetical protein
MGARRQNRPYADDGAVGTDHFSGKHFRCGRRTEAVCQFNQHGTSAQPDPRRAEPVTYR